MSIHHHPTKEPLMPPPPLPWGETAADKAGKGAAVRFVLADRVVSFPCGELKRWEHIPGNPERLLITVGNELVRIEGRELIEVRSALDEFRLLEVRTGGSKPSARDGTVVSRITLEPV